MRPQYAISPRDRIRPGSLEVIHTSKDGSWSLASMSWRRGDDYDDPNNWYDVIGCRWNGDLDDANDKGNPRSHSQGTWFILPEPMKALAEGLVHALAEANPAEIDDDDTD